MLIFAFIIAAIIAYIGVMLLLVRLMPKFPEAEQHRVIEFVGSREEML